LFTQHTTIISQTLGWAPDSGSVPMHGYSSCASPVGSSTTEAGHAGRRQPSTQHALLCLPSHIAGLAREFDDYALTSTLRSTLQQLTLGPVGLA
jgi:hypothetical protein